MEEEHDRLIKEILKEVYDLKLDIILSSLLTVLLERIFYAGPNRLYLKTAPEV